MKKLRKRGQRLFYDWKSKFGTGSVLHRPSVYFVLLCVAVYWTFPEQLARVQPLHYKRCKMISSKTVPAAFDRDVDAMLAGFYQNCTQLTPREVKLGIWNETLAIADILEGMDKVKLLLDSRHDAVEVTRVILPKYLCLHTTPTSHSDPLPCPTHVNICLMNVYSAHKSEKTLVNPKRVAPPEDRPSQDVSRITRLKVESIFVQNETVSLSMFHQPTLVLKYFSWPDGVLKTREYEKPLSQQLQIAELLLNAPAKFDRDAK